MSSRNDFIVIDESHNLDDNTAETSISGQAAQSDIRDASEEVSRQTLHKQGIFIEKRDETVATLKPLDEFSRELFDEGGIEIVPNGGNRGIENNDEL